jgi:putative transposase
MNHMPAPSDSAEAIALFRFGIIGGLVTRDRRRGELKRTLRELSYERYLPPGGLSARTFSVPTLERWLYAYLDGGLVALKPKPRRDRGHARALTEEQRTLLVEVRREYPTASAELVLETLAQSGRLERGRVSPTTVRRLWVASGLDYKVCQQRANGRVRRRWEAAYPGQLWHADVCHGPALTIDGRTKPLRIHAILDDASRYVVAIRACHTERESDMLGLFTDAVRRHGRSSTLYLDNGSTYRGQALDTACGRLGTRLVHARPYDPQARGKMERLWRSLRGDILDHLPTMTSLHDVQVRLLAWLDQYYHSRAHSGLMGKSPATVWLSNRCDPVTSEELRVALTVRGRRRVRTDGTLSIGGVDWETEQGFLAGKSVTVARTLASPTERPWIEDDEATYALTRVDPKANATRGRRTFRPKPGIDAVAFDPAGAFLDSAVGRTRPTRGGVR